MRDSSPRGPWLEVLRDGVIFHEDLTDPIWDEILGFAMREGFCGILIERLADIGLRPPRRVKDQLRSVASGVAAANLQKLHALERLIAAFHRESVPLMLLKGAALLQTSYPDPSLRPMSDLDLMIRPADCERAASLLRDLGARSGQTLITNDFFPRFHYETEWNVPAPGIAPVRIDLHVRPLRPLRVSRTMPDDALWESATPVSIGSAAALVPRPEYMLIHLAAHAAFHGWERVMWVYDISRWIERCGDVLDWDLVLRRCRDWKLSLAVSGSLARCVEFFGIALPMGFLAALTGQPTSWRDRLVLWQSPRDAASPLAHVACNLLCTPGIRFRLDYLKAILMPDPRHLRQSYEGRHPGWKTIAQATRLARASLKASHALAASLRA